MKRSFFVVVASLALFSAQFTESTSLQNDYPIRFEIRKGFWSVEGYFSEIETHLRFTPNEPEKIVLSGKAKVSSIDTDNETRDSHLMGADWFDAAQHPKIEMQAVSVEPTTSGYRGTFLITIKGRRIRKKLDFTLVDGQGSSTLSATFSLSREVFALEGSNPIMEAMLGDEVKVHLNIPLNTLSS